MLDTTKSDGWGSPNNPEKSPSGVNRGVWHLTGRTGPDAAIADVLINVSPFLVGRRPDASLSLPFQTVSKTHAEFIDTGDTLILRDLNSTNGTYVNDWRVNTEIALKPHDLIQFGEVVLRLLYQTLPQSRGASTSISEDPATL